MTGALHDEDSMPRLAIGFDIGGTKIACGVLDSNGRRVDTLPPTPTPKGSAETVDLLSATVKELRSQHPGVEAVGVGAAGLIQWPEGLITFAPNNSYRDLPLRKLLEQACELPTIVDNDANVAAWAEARLSGMPDYMMFLTVGTGVGGGLILGGELYRGSSGIGGEVGHLIVDPYGEARCGCGNIGCLEAVASGTALGRYGSAAAEADPGGVIATLAGGPGAVTGEVVRVAAVTGDPVARSLYERIGGWLGVGIASLVTILDLRRVAIGGGVASAGNLLLDPMRASLNRYLFARDYRAAPEIVLARQGTDAGWIGAALLALDSTPTA